MPDCLWNGSSWSYISIALSLHFARTACWSPSEHPHIHLYHSKKSLLINPEHVWESSCFKFSSVSKSSSDSCLYIQGFIAMLLLILHNFYGTKWCVMAESAGLGVLILNDGEIMAYVELHLLSILVSFYPQWTYCDFPTCGIDTFELWYGEDIHQHSCHTLFPSIVGGISPPLISLRSEIRYPFSL